MVRGPPVLADSLLFRPPPGHIFVFKHKTGGEMAGSAQTAGPGIAPGARAEAAREVLALRNLVAVYRHLSGLAVQDADLAAVTRLISEQTDATVAVVSPTMDILTAAAPGQTGERAAQDVRDLVVHPRLGEVLHRALEFVPADRLMVNPDCGLRRL